VTYIIVREEAEIYRWGDHFPINTPYCRTNIYLMMVSLWGVPRGRFSPKDRFTIE
jgi:hypothetical protein